MTRAEVVVVLQVPGRLEAGGDLFEKNDFSDELRGGELDREEGGKIQGHDSACVCGRSKTHC